MKPEKILNLFQEILCHSFPLFFKLSTSSFFFASTDITGWLFS